MKRIVTLVFVVISISCIAQKKIIGRAIDSETKSPIKNLRILIPENGFETFTNHLGYFEINVGEPIKKISVEHVSYETADVPLPEQGNLMFSLKKQALVIPVVDIRSFIRTSGFKILTDTTEAIPKDMSRPIAFNGGVEGFREYLGENVRIDSSIENNFIVTYPDTAFVVDADFTVDRQGMTKDINIAGDTLFGMAAVFREVLSNAKWKPAIQRGETCDQKVKMRILYGDWVFTIIDKSVSFPGSGSGDFGGDVSDFSGFYAYIMGNIKYPSEARRKGIEGKVFVEFTVDKRGNVIKDKVKVVKGVSQSLDDEAMRLVSNSPKWIPASHRGVNVYQRVVLPITFRLTSGKR